VGRGDRQGVAITIAEPRERRLLRTIERSIRQKIDIAKVPTTAELRERRMSATRDSLASICLDDDLDGYRGLLGSLTLDFDLDQVALAAIKMAHVATAGEAGEADIPQVEFSSSERDGGRTKRGGKASDRGRRSGKGPRGERHGKVQRIFISAGSEAGIRPQDVVGAIANETALTGSAVGAIDISARFTTVDVPAEAAKEVIAALSATRIKGKKVKARRDRH
jgi:ATP-dependent RNA helicase DeaD